MHSALTGQLAVANELGDVSRMSKVDNAGNIVIGVYLCQGVQIGDYHSGDYGGQVVVKYKFRKEITFGAMLLRLALD